jgi:hypothetical protein
VTVALLFFLSIAGAVKDDTNGTQIRDFSISAVDVLTATGLLHGKPVKIPPGLQFAKLKFAFLSPTKVGEVIVESCDADFKDGGDFYFSPGLSHYFSEGGRRTLQIKLAENQDPVNEISIVFRHNDGFCLKSFKVVAPGGQPLDVHLVVSDAVHPPSQQSPEVVKSIFSKSDVAAALDSELYYLDDQDRWLFRFRSDGSFFVRGFSDDMKQSRAFSALGTFVVKSGKGNRVELKLKGVRITTSMPWDGLLTDKESALVTGSGPVSEQIVIEKWAASSYMIRNQTDLKVRTLPFSDVRTELSTLSE